MDLGLKSTEPVKNILDIKIPNRLKYRVKSNHTLDKIIGGDQNPGIPAGSIILFTGRSGGGKSTLMQQYLDDLEGLRKDYGGFLGFGAKTFFNSTEQTAIDVSQRVHNITDIQNGFPFGSFTSNKKLFNYCEKEYECSLPKDIDEYTHLPKHDLTIVIDSLPGMRIDDEEEFNQTDVASDIISWCKKNYVTVFLLGHVTKTGNAAGKNELVHIVDAHMHIDFYEEKHEKKFYVSMIKNRIGPIENKFWFENKKEGIKFLNEDFD